MACIRAGAFLGSIWAGAISVVDLSKTVAQKNPAAALAGRGRSKGVAVSSLVTSVPHAAPKARDKPEQAKSICLQGLDAFCQSDR